MNSFGKIDLLHPVGLCQSRLYVFAVRRVTFMVLQPILDRLVAAPSINMLETQSKFNYYGHVNITNKIFIFLYLVQLSKRLFIVVVKSVNDSFSNEAMICHAFSTCLHVYI